VEAKKCKNCNKEINADAKFCGFCGEKFLEKKPTTPKSKNSFFTARQTTFVVLFLLYLSFSYFTSMGNTIGEFYQRSTELEITLTSFQEYFIDSLMYIFDFILSMLFIGLFAYWFKNLKTWACLLAGLFMRYWLGLALVAFFIITGEDMSGDWSSEFLYMIIPQIVAVLVGSFVGAKVGSRFTYSDPRDRTNFFFWGLSKKFWVLMTVAYNPIIYFLRKLSIFAFYTASKAISEVTDWANFLSTGSFVGVLIVVAIPFVLLAVSLKLFAIGIEAVKNKQSKFRRTKIIIFLILMPILTVLIPIIRNRTWFF